MTMSAAPETCSSNEAKGRELRGMRERLVRQFDDVPGDVVDQCISEVVQRFEDARIVAFLPILIEKHARLALLVERQAIRERGRQAALDAQNEPSEADWQRPFPIMRTG